MSTKMSNEPQSNPFEEMEAFVTGPRRSRLRAIQTRAARRRQKELAERDILYRLWKKWHSERRDELLAGHFSEQAREVADYLERMTIDDAPGLIELVENGPWCSADANTKFLLLSMIDHAVIYQRERAGLVSFDDALPFSDEEPTAFQILRELLR